MLPLDLWCVKVVVFPFLGLPSCASPTTTAVVTPTALVALAEELLAIKLLDEASTTWPSLTLSMLGSLSGLSYPTL